MGSDRERMSFHHSSGVWGAIALAVFLVPGAVLVAGIAVGFIDASVIAAGAGATYALFGLGVVLILIGAAAALWRIEVVIDAGSRTVTERRWLVGFTRCETYAWDSLAGIQIVSAAKCYEVRIDATDGSIYLEAYSDRAAARSAADEVAALTSLPIDDRTGG